jgi:hypothetical protein
MIAEERAALEQIMAEWGWSRADDGAGDFTAGDYAAAEDMVIDAMRILIERGQVVVSRLPVTWQKRWGT